MDVSDVQILHERIGKLERAQLVHVQLIVDLAKELQTAPSAGCICRGNWRAIIKDVERRIGHTFQSSAGERFTFFGVVHGAEDYYYGLHGGGALRLLSCVGTIEGHGYEDVTVTTSEVPK